MVFCCALLTIALYQLASSSSINTTIKQQMISRINVSGNNSFADYSGYIVTPGIGAHKYHTEAREWNEARRVCVAEGAHLAIINSEKEEELIVKHLIDNNLNTVWIGVHEQFQNDDWITVLDQSLYSIGHVHWSQGEPNHVNNNEHCIEFGKTGMNDCICRAARFFICKKYL